MDRNNIERAGVQYYVRRSGSARKEGKKPSDMGGRAHQVMGTANTKVLRREGPGVFQEQQGGQCGWSRVSKGRT